MTIVDRYLTFMFIRIFFVSLISFTGLFVMVHLFSNLDEMMALAEEGGWAKLAWDFYAPRVAEVFDKTAAVWTLCAAVFAINLMQRRREMTAVEAAGITKSRILRPILFCSLFIFGVAAANRELVLPQVKDRLVRTPQNWDKQDNLPFNVFHDVRTGIKIRGSELSLKQQTISKIEVQLPQAFETMGSRLQAPLAVIEPADERHPAGLRLRGVKINSDIAELVSQADENGTIVYWPADTTWLQPDECFVVCDFDAYQAIYGKKLQEYQSLAEMLVNLRKPREWYGKDNEISVHARLLKPVLDFTLLFLGLPLAIARIDKNIFVSAGICFLVVGGLQLTVIAAHSLGSYSLIEPAALAAWLPVILFTPLAVVAMKGINR